MQSTQPPAAQRLDSPKLWSPHKSIDNTFLALFRIAWGTCLLWQIWWYFSTDLIRTYYIDPPFHFTYLYFGWVKPWSGDWMYVHFFALAVAALCILLGFYYRLATILFFVGYTHVFLIDKCWYLNHYYLISLVSFVIIFLPAERRFAMDAWRRPNLATSFAPTWTLWLLRAQIGIPYFFGGVAKLNADWLRGEPMRTWLAQSSDFPLIGSWFTQEWCVYFMSYSGLFIDLLAVPCLLWKRTRPWALAILLMFHLMNVRLFQIGVFPWMMIALTLIGFTEPDRWRRLLPAVANPAQPSRIPHWAAAILILFLVVQLIVPWRHWLYPGNVAFTREGHHFSWRMKLNERTVASKFSVLPPESGQPVPVSLVPYVMGYQESKMRDPDMILQLAHHISDQLSAGGDRVPVLADVTVELNGRPPADLTSDPSTNLAAVPRTIRHARWIHGSPEDSQ